MEVYLYAAIGRELTQYRVNVQLGALTALSKMQLPQGLQYLWQQPELSVFYAACSDGRPGFDGTEHCVCALNGSGESQLTVYGPVVSLPWRPVHITTDPAGRFIFITYPRPSAIDVFRINSDGTIGEKVEQPPFAELQKVAHQLRITADGRYAVLPLRGNDATSDRPEDPGAIAIMDVRDGVLSMRQTLAPDDGRGFGPRHVDFHPSRPWMYVSIERQNELSFFHMGAEFSGPYCRLSTLTRQHEEKPRQLVGAVHVHPDGLTVYVSNRADGTVQKSGRAVFNGGENTIAVFRIDPSTGVPSRIQTIDTRGMHTRTFQLHPSGHLLVAANMTPRWSEKDGHVREIHAGLSIFRVHSDGTLEFLNKLDVDARHAHLFWAGFLEH